MDRLLTALCVNHPDRCAPAYADYVAYIERSKAFKPARITKPKEGTEPCRDRYLAYLHEELDGTGFDARDIAASTKYRHAEYRWRAWKRLHDDGFSVASIGRVAGKDHTAVLHGLKRLAAIEASAPLAQAWV